MSICNDPVKVHVWYVCVFCGMTHMYTERATVVLKHHAYHANYIQLSSGVNISAETQVPKGLCPRVSRPHRWCQTKGAPPKHKPSQTISVFPSPLWSRVHRLPMCSATGVHCNQCCYERRIGFLLQSLFACSYRIYCTYLVMEIHLWLLVYGLVGPLSQGTNSRRIGRFLCLYLWLYHVVSVYHHTGPRVSPTSCFGNDRNDSWLRHDWNFAHQAVETETQTCQEYWNVLNY